MVDPNIRPGFVTDPDRYRARVGAMIARADIVKLSDEDLHWLEGPGDPVALARAVLDRGPRLVFLTEGAKGAPAITPAAEVFAAAPAVTVADTVGAGDTFNAGALDRATLAAALPEDTLRKALERGVAAAAVTVGRAGANPPWAHELA